MGVFRRCGRCAGVHESGGWCGGRGETLPGFPAMCSVILSGVWWVGVRGFRSLIVAGTLRLAVLGWVLVPEGCRHRILAMSSQDFSVGERSRVLKSVLNG